MAGTATKLMPSSSRYLSLASSRLSSLKGKVTQYREDPNSSYMPSGVSRSPSNSQNWKQWAGQKIRRNLTKSEGKLVGYEEIVLFPGWAAKRYIDISGRPNSQGLSSLRNYLTTSKAKNTAAANRTFRGRCVCLGIRYSLSPS